MIFNKTARRIDSCIEILKERSYLPSPKARLSSWSCASTDRTFGERVPDLPFSPIEFPFAYGSDWLNWWFAATADLPEGDGRLFVELQTETDSMVFVDRVCEGAVNPFHRMLELSRFAGRTVSLHVEAWAGHRFPGYHPSEGGRVLTTVAMRKKGYPLTFVEPRILERQEDTCRLYWDVLTLRKLASTLDQDGFLCQKILSTLHDALMGIDWFPASSDTWEEQVRAADRAIGPLLEAKNGTFAPQIYSVGSSHLDHAWLWPIGETTRKAARTCLNMVSFAESYPEFSFLFPQPAQMVALRREYPSVYARVLRAYRSGCWEPNGISYVEPDCVLSGGESLIRQCLKGRKTTADLFDGYQGDVFWLPDSFGYTAALPQILVGCGARYFVTSKLSWNDTNRFPYDLFEWESLDGSRIRCHMIQGAYEGTCDPENVRQAWDSVLHKDLQEGLMRSVGEGDGGGGPMASDFEFMRREQDLQGLPRNRWSTLSEAMEQIFAGKDRLPVYRGELYLELHRGTYTSQARLKWYNRKLEGMLHSAEYLAALCICEGRDDGGLGDAIEEAWEILLVNQFHDILPGSSIREVNEEAERAYGRAVSALAPYLEPEGATFLLNPNGFSCPLADGTLLPPYRIGVALPRSEGRPICRDLLETEWGTLQLDGHGGISSLILKSDGRQLVEEGKAFNTIATGEDYPLAWDAWDIDSDSLEKQRRVFGEAPLEVSERKLCYTVRQRIALGKRSYLEQEMTVYRKIGRIDFDCTVHWHERHTLLRVQFPTTLHPEYGLFDVPFGYISRANNRNTSIERARFEVPAHRWAALRDDKLAVALASDSKYGYMVDGGTLSLSLLRSPTAPDPEADQGVHRFVYSLILSDGGLLPVMEHAAALNNPPVPVSEMHLPLCEVLYSSVVIETVKVSEDRRRIAIRLREPLGIPQRCALRFSPLLDERTLVETDMLERPLSDGFSPFFKPFAVRTLTIAPVSGT